MVLAREALLSGPLLGEDSVPATEVRVTAPSGGEIVWTFSASHEVGQFANGDWWVVGPVTITSISPFVIEGDRHRNGTMLDPAADGGRNQGYDSATFAGNAASFWSPALCENLSLPKTYQPGQTLVSTISVPPAGSLPQVQFAATLTVVAAEPAEDAFRPPYCASTPTNKVPRFRVSDLDLSGLPSLFSWSTLMEPGRPVATVLDNLSRQRIDHIRGWLNNYVAPVDNQEDYSRDETANIGDALLGLISDLDIATKRQLAMRVVQIGLDTYPMLANGMYWEADGGQASGRKFPILLAGLLLNDQDMLDVGADYPSPHGGPSRFGEDGQTFLVEETSTGVYNRGFGGYDASHVGLAEWGIRHTLPQGPLAEAQRDSVEWDRPGINRYRVAGTAHCWVAQVLVALALGLEAEWNHAPLFAYQDRYMTEMLTRIDPSTGQVYADEWRAWHPEHGEVWDEVRSQVGSEPTTTGEYIWGAIRMTASQPTLTLGSVTRTALAASLTLTASTPSGQLSAIQIGPPAVPSVTLSAAAPAITFGNASATTQAASITLTAGTPLGTVGNATGTAAPASVALTAGAPSLTVGSVKREPVPAQVSIYFLDAARPAGVVAAPAGTMQAANPRNYGELGGRQNVISTQVPVGTEAFEGAAMGRIVGAGIVRPLQAGDPFAGFLDRPPLATTEGLTDCLVRTVGATYLLVAGVTGDANYGDIVYALSDDEFTIDEAAGGSPIGKILAYAGGRWAKVWFEAETWRRPAPQTVSEPPPSNYYNNSLPDAEVEPEP